MKWTLILLLFAQFGLAQSEDSSFQKKSLTTLEVTTFFSFYNQEGTHSAVTGGEGDEHLQVYHTGANIAYGIDASLIIFNAGVDVIASPSTDKIDFIKSSASGHDNHVHAKAGYQYHFKKQNIRLGLAYLWSIESDYWSNGISTWGGWTSPKKTSSIAWAFDFFFDDLRWGRLSKAQGNKPTQLIYPAELRHIDWFDIYHRNSYNFNINFRQDINRRLRVNVSLGATYQEGLLSTPFHRVYFSDSNIRKVENLPQQRIRLPLSIAANWFMGKSIVWQPSYRIYWDNFGIFAHTINLQTAIKPNNKWSFYPFVRAYYQTGSPYFAPYKEHLSSALFYTSDYDFSTLGTFKAGLGIGWFPDFRLGKKSKLYVNNIVIRYAFLYRTDGLSAHMISLQMGVKK
ncbi:DUF3570 domain-containing protein [Aureispira anguillae]|uniref:DUF3570 domain-containing protein n=1 Tax=Aureispira anguillae TaxID=2864201 RepID=A0A915YG34_9BACT|nr:DUF3570 domain-containing protein [Aureispira anguillae]BDS12515.1 DUF3570 domain-containing protein [Aureispira anguillae]